MTRERAEAPKPNPRRYWAAIGIGAGVCVCIAAVARGPSVVPMLALAVSWGLSVGFYALINSGQPMSQGEIGERTALRDLAKSPLLASDAGDYTAITSCRVPGYEQIGDLDIVMVGPMGVAVIEVKNFLRPLRVSGETWVAEERHGGAPMKSVSRQLDNEVKALAKALARSGAQTPVHGLIGINANAVIQIDAPPPPYPIVAYHALADAVAALPASDLPVPREQILSLLAPDALQVEQNERQ